MRATDDRPSVGSRGRDRLLEPRCCRSIRLPGGGGWHGRHDRGAGGLRSGLWLGGQRHPRRRNRHRDASHGGGCRSGGHRSQPKRLPALAQQRFQFATGRGPIDATNFLTLDQEHITRHAGHAEPSDEIPLVIDVDMPHDPACCRDFTHQRRHLPARATPRRGEIEKDDIASRDGRWIGANRGSAQCHQPHRDCHSEEESRGPCHP